MHPADDAHESADNESLQAEGIQVSTPLGSPVTYESSDDLFVRFESDDPNHSDEMVETVALHSILSPDAVYVVAPSGYIGRTTCYEVGHAIQARRPMYFSERPADLPVRIPDGHIMSVSGFITVLTAHSPAR